MTESLWWTYIPHLRTLPAKHKEPQGESVTLLGDTSLPVDIIKVLEKGPKFCTAPKTQGVHMLETIRDIAAKTQEDDRKRCVDDLVGVLLKTGPRCKNKLKISGLVDYFKRENFKLLVSDKEGGFVVCPGSVYLEKAGVAI